LKNIPEDGSDACKSFFELLATFGKNFNTCLQENNAIKIASEKNMKMLNNESSNSSNNNNALKTNGAEIVAESLNKNLKQNVDLISALKQQQQIKLNKNLTPNGLKTPPPPPPRKDVSDNIFNKFNQQANNVSSDSVVAEFKNKLLKFF
jgi:hypothetical protein